MDDPESSKFVLQVVTIDEDTGKPTHTISAPIPEDVFGTGPHFSASNPFHFKAMNASAISFRDPTDHIWIWYFLYPRVPW